ncbi:MAG: hypothetical protein IT361_04410 [Gemmatimonadaceae bacterium]|nr:hypothetical protein [Gemmatimonadaceae bacterium]
MRIFLRRLGWTLRQVVGAIGFEHAVFLLALAALGVSIVLTVTASTGSIADLTYDGARDETRALVRNRGGDFVSHARVRLSSSGQRIVVDSLTATGDSTELPALGRGGYLRDQIDAFNAEASKRAWLPALLGREPTGPPAVSRSLLRLARTDAGTWVVSERMNASPHAVRAPGTEREGAIVRPAGARTGPGVIRRFADELLDGRTTSSRVDAPAACHARVITPRERLLSCLSPAGLGVGKGFDLRVKSDGADFAGGGLALSREDGSAFWLNGARVLREARARTGDLVFLPGTGALAFSRIDPDRLSGPQWINGRSTFQATGTGSLRHFARAGRLMALPDGEQTLTLSIDAALTRDIDEELARFIAERRDYVEQASVVVMDLASGELKAIAESTTGDEPLLAMEPVLLGSMSKPLLAAAILSQQPRLADLTITRSEGRFGTVRGLPLVAGIANPSNGCPAVVDFEHFLECSSNQYAAELFIASLQDGAGATITDRRGRVGGAVLSQAPVVDGLLGLFDDVDVVADRRAGRTSRLWRRDTVPNPAIDVVPRDASLLPWVSRPWFIYPDSIGVPVDWLARFAIGGWENRWTLVGAMEAYARIATDRRVHLSVRQQPAGGVARFGSVPREAARAFARVRGGLALVTSSGTASGLDHTIAAIGRFPDSMVVMGKTGTLNEAASADAPDGVFLKALALVAGIPASSSANAPLRCGVGAIVYLTFRDDWVERTGAVSTAALPSLHLQFARSSLAGALARQWRRHDPCAGSNAAPR